MPGLRPKSTAPCKDGSKDEGMNFHGQTDTKYTAGHLNLGALSPGRTDANPAHFPARDSDLMPLRASGRGLNRKGCIVPFPSINASLNDCIDRKSTQAHQHSTHFPNPARTSFLYPISLSFWLACRVPTGRVGAVDDVPGLSVISLRDSNVNIKLQTPRQIDSRVKVLSTCPDHTSSSRSRCTTLMSAFESLRGRYLSFSWEVQELRGILSSSDRSRSRETGILHTEAQRQTLASQAQPAGQLPRASISAAAPTSLAGLGAAMARLAKRAKATVVSLMVAVLLVLEVCC